MHRRFLTLCMILIITQTSAIVPSNYYPENCCEESVCCSSEPCEKPCSWGLYSGAFLAAIVGGGIAGALISKGKKGSRGHRGKTGPLPALVYDPDPAQSISFNVSVEFQVAGANPNITLTPFITDPAGKTTLFASFPANTSGVYTNPTPMVVNNLINGTYFWGFLCSPQDAVGTRIVITSDNSWWTAIPSRYPDIEIGIPLSELNDLVIAAPIVVQPIQLLGFMDYDYAAF